MAKKWTSEDEKYLFEHYGKVSNKELADHFGVSPKSVANKMSSLRKAGILEPKGAKLERKKAEAKAAPTKADIITPLSAIAKKKTPAPIKAKQTAAKPEPEGPPEYIPTKIMIMTDEGWKPINIDKHKIKH